MEITVILKAEPTLVALLENLGKALLVSGQDMKEAAEAITTNPTPAQSIPAQAPAPIAATIPAPSIPAAPVTPPMTNPAPVAPTYQPQPVYQAPAAPPVAPVAPLPTAAPTFTLDQLAVAATGLVDAGKVAELMNLLGQFGCQALTQLPAEMYGHFATALRGMGAQI